MGKFLDLSEFVSLMLVSMANNSEKVAAILVDYKQRIENILCA